MIHFSGIQQYEIGNYTRKKYAFFARFSSAYVPVVTDIKSTKKTYVNLEKIARVHELSIQTLRLLVRNLQQPNFWPSLVSSIDQILKIRTGFDRISRENSDKESLELVALMHTCVISHPIANQNVWILHLDRPSPLIGTEVLSPIIFEESQKVSASCATVFRALWPNKTRQEHTQELIIKAAIIQDEEGEKKQTDNTRVPHLQRERDKIFELHKRLSYSSTSAKLHSCSQIISNRSFFGENERIQNIPSIPLGPIQACYQNQKWAALVHPYYNLGSLSKELFQNKEELIEACRQVLVSLSHYHRADLVHYDVKKDNFFVQSIKDEENQESVHFEIILGDCESALSKDEAKQAYENNESLRSRRFSKAYRLTEHCYPQKPKEVAYSEERFWQNLLSMDVIGAILTIIELTTTFSHHDWINRASSTCSNTRILRASDTIRQEWQILGFSEVLISKLLAPFHATQVIPSAPELLSLFSSMRHTHKK